MPNPNAHDQPAEGDREVVERALQKQSETPPNPPRDKPKATPENDRKKQK